MSSKWPTHRELPRDIRHKPITVANPLARVYEADKKQNADIARQTVKMQEKISRRAAERLEIAEARHKNVLSGLEVQHDADVQRLLVDTKIRDEEAERLELTAKLHTDQMTAETREQEAAHDRHVASRQMALDRVEVARSQTVANTAATEAQWKQAQQRADESITNSQQNAQSHLSELSRHRADIHSNLAQDCKLRENKCDTVLKELDVKSHKDMVRAEITRHRAIMAMDIAGGRSQEMRTESQARVLRNEAKAKDQALTIDQNSYTLQKRVDCILNEKLKDSALNLEAANEYCQEVRNLLASEAAQFKRRIREIELGADFNCREEERKVRSLEKDRLQEFMKDQASVIQSETSIRSKRAESDSEIDDIHRRLIEVEGRCRQRAEEIGLQWIASSEAAEQAVRRLEEQGRQIMQTFKDTVDKKLKDFLEQDAAAKGQGSANVADLERKATTVIETTQSELERKRGEDERAAASAMARWQAARSLPEEITKKADDDIAAKERRAQDEEAELRRLAEVRIAAARAATKAAHQEELWLQAETSDTWARLRKASFELKKASLHDLAQSTVAGDYDAELHEIADFVKV